MSPDSFTTDVIAQEIADSHPAEVAEEPLRLRERIKFLERRKQELSLRSERVDYDEDED